MKAVINFIKWHGYAAYLGGWLSAIGVKLSDWRFWAILVPVLVLINWGYSKDK